MGRHHEWRAAALAACLACHGCVAAADDNVYETAPTATDPTPTTAPMQPGAVRVPAATQVVIEIGESLLSWKHQRGDRFGITLAEPLRVDGVELLPAGTSGTGEVVHAAAARSGGAPGELIVAARTLQSGDRSISLRGFRLGGAGDDNSGMAMGVSFAAGPFALFIRGREIEIPAGTRGVARLREEIVLAPPPAQDPPSPQASPSGDIREPAHPPTKE